jgi:23S rRNA (adenine2503-C2)-methyltransferase
MPSPERVEAFQNQVRAQGYSVFVRRQRGDEIDAACGQLALRGAQPKKRRLPTIADQGRTDA